MPKDLSLAFEIGARAMPRARLGKGSWRFEEESLARLRDKIAAGRRSLGEVYGPPLYGIKTGFNDAFIVDTETRDRLVAADPKSEELLKPFLRGENIKRWRVESEGLFLINTPKGKVDIDAYPAIRDWLLPFRPQLEARATKQAWFELQQAQVAYQPKMVAPKIVYQDITADNPFAIERSGSLLANTCYFLAADDVSLLAFLNGRTAWFFLTAETNIARGGYLRLRTEFVERVPVPNPPKRERTHLATLGEICTTAATRRFELQSAVRHRILDLATTLGRRKLSGKLEAWWTLDFDAFRAEVQKVFRNEVPVGERDDWERYLADNAAEVKALTAKIEDAEREIDQIVYRLFDLTTDEIRLLEGSLEGQQ